MGKNLWSLRKKKNKKMAFEGKTNEELKGERGGKKVAFGVVH